MPEIVTITFNPAIDKSTSVPELLPERKLKCAMPHYEPGGGGVNVARVLHRLGASVAAIYPSGGYPGKFYDDLLIKENLPILPIAMSGNTRENLVVLDEKNNAQYRLGMPGASLSEREWRACVEAIRSFENIKYLVVSGSLAPGVPASVFEDIKIVATSISARLVVDTSGEPLRSAANAGVFLLKPNLGELAALTGHTRIPEDDIPAIGREFISKQAAAMLLVSMGEQGAMLITEQEVWKASPPLLPRKSTVGAGDSMVAGFIYALNTGKTTAEALAYAVATGTATTRHPGTELCKAGDPEKLLSQVCLKELKC